jgi:hypothetical protein
MAGYCMIRQYIERSSFGWLAAAQNSRVASVRWSESDVDVGKVYQESTAAPSLLKDRRARYPRKEISWQTSLL